MCYYSQGGFTFAEVYSMPIYLRNFYITELEKVKKLEKEEHDKASKQSSNLARPNIPR
tara:strand:- start:67 stop:240 length:174 start_codon:yes stop_codon:yes gene_type:complete